MRYGDKPWIRRIVLAIPSNKAIIKILVNASDHVRLWEMLTNRHWMYFGGKFLLLAALCTLS